MKRIMFAAVFLLSFIVGTILSCKDNCPDLEKNERGSFWIVNGDGLISGGVLHIRDNEVEVVYPDDDNNVWHVVYNLVKEE